MNDQRETIEHIKFYLEQIKLNAERIADQSECGTARAHADEIKHLASKLTANICDMIGEPIRYIAELREDRWGVTEYVNETPIRFAWFGEESSAIRAAEGFTCGNYDPKRFYWETL